MKNTRWILFILIFVLLLAACSDPTPVPPGPQVEASATTAPSVTAPPPPEVQPTPEVETEPVEDAVEISQPISRWNAVSEKGSWVLVSYGDSLNPTVVQPGTYVTINFSVTDDQVNGSGGCNTYFTSFTADDDYNLTISGPVGSTRMACETGMEQEALYFRALETVTSYMINQHGELLLDYDSGTAYDAQFVFISEALLVDTHWTLTAYGNPDSLTMITPGVVTTAIFSSNGMINGSTGCNNYVANYTTQGDQIMISLPTASFPPCGIGLDQERAFIALLGDAQSYRLGVDSLQISSTDGSVLRFSGQHPPLENVRWLLASINGQALPDDVSASALFTPEDSPAAEGNQNTVTGSAGCNTFFGPYSTTGDTLTTGPFGSGQAMCDEAIMQVEQSFLRGLESAKSYQITRNQLVINSSSGTLLFYADRLPLEGPKWILTGMGAIDNPQPPIEGGVFTANFTQPFGMPSGTKSGTTGCRDYTATYYCGDDRIKVNLPETSQGICSDAQLEAEQGYFLGLNATQDYRILGNELYAYYQDQVLIFVGNYPAANIGPLAPLHNTEWWLTSIDNFLVVPDSEVTISFEINPDGRTGVISGSSGCNTYHANIAEVFALGAVISTAKTCDSPEGVMEQEGVYLTALQTANLVEVDGSTLRITTEQEVLNFTIKDALPFQPTATPTPSAPTAVIDAPRDEHVGATIVYDASLSTSNAEIISYHWWFTGDHTAEGLVVERTYDSTGAYDAILTIRDENGFKSETSVKTNIHTFLVGPLWVSEDSRVTMSFDGSTLSGNAGCNDFNAGYTGTDVAGKANDLSIGDIYRTDMTCDQDVMDHENSFLTDLEKATSFSIHIKKMTITTAGRTLTFYATP